MSDKEPFSWRQRPQALGESRRKEKKTFVEIEIEMTRVTELILEKRAKSGQDWEGAIRA